jgi:Fe-S-cluster containining protein|tara:strand:+ start:4358 stop:4771 length:414 start_codon:yes stop_codon:yes gene_type:complete
MKDSDFPLPIRVWPLPEEAITEEVCQRCGICCEIEIKPSWTDPRRFEWLRAIVENHDNIQSTEKGIRIRCSHLKETVMGWKRMGCDIYDDRPQLCRDFNCVSWAKYSGDTTQYNRVLERMGLLKDSNFPEELRGADI